jgi:hypothetical protein
MSDPDLSAAIPALTPVQANIAALLARYTAAVPKTVTPGEEPEYPPCPPDPAASS